MTTETFSYNKLILQNESSFRRSYLLSLNVVYIRTFFIRTRGEKFVE